MLRPRSTSMRIFREAHLLMGKVLFDDGQISIAMQFFVTAFSLDDRCAEAYLNLSLCFDLLKSPKEAHQYARKAAAQDPRYKKYTAEPIRRTLISPNLVQRLQTFKANVHELYPELTDDTGQNTPEAKNANQQVGQDFEISILSKSKQK